ncbi:MAG: chemotaxis response regulator protein-glutamate methylesterase [Pseudomonadota bacterium]
MSVNALRTSSEAPSRTPRPVKVMVVDDSAVIRGLLSRWIGEADGVDVVGSAPNGKLAVERLETLDPDIVVLDIEMPEMDGLTALPLMLKSKPGLIVVMASTLTRRNADISLKALSLGATDYIPKPEGNSGVTTSVEFRRDLIERISGLAPKAIANAARRKASASTSRDTMRRLEQRVESRIKTPAAAPAITKPRSALASVPASQIALRQPSAVPPRVLVIGSSTGGPPALAKVFAELKPVVPKVPILVTQHMPPTFTAILAEHITKTAGAPAAEGVDGEAITAGRIYVAPGGKHMVIGGSSTAPVIRLNDDPPVNFCRPAVDPLFESASKIFGPAILAAVLTGMGQDGAAGGVVIANAGGTVIAQDEETSVVWGMPGATAQAGCCAAVLPLDRIGPKLAAIIGGKRS